MSGHPGNTNGMFAVLPGACEAGRALLSLLFRKPCFVPALSCVFLSVLAVSVSAQELTPRTYWPAPHGTKFVVVGYSHSTGDIVTDPSLPLVGVDSTIDTGILAYQQTVNLAGRTTNIQFELPYVHGNTTGEFQGQAASREVSGIGDFSATLSVNLMGAPSMTKSEFQEFRKNPKPILATSIKVVAPTGEYDADKLINIGTNRWAAKLKLGYLVPMPAKTVLEMAAGVWIFEDNDEFVGSTREQEPVGALDLSVVKRFRPGFWGSIDANYYLGGRTTVDGNKRAGFMTAYVFLRRNGWQLEAPETEATRVMLSLAAGEIGEEELGLWFGESCRRIEA